MKFRKFETMLGSERIRTRFAWLPELIKEADGTLVTVWLERYDAREVYMEFEFGGGQHGPHMVIGWYGVESRPAGYFKEGGK